MRALLMTASCLVPFAAVAQVSGMGATGTVNSDGSISIPLMRNGISVMGTIQAGLVVLPATALPTAVLSNLSIVQSAENLDAVARLQNAMPGETLTLTDTMGALKAQGLVVRVADHTKLVPGPDVVTYTRSLAGYLPIVQSVTMTVVPPPNGPRLVMSAVSDGTVILWDNFTTPIAADIYGPTTNPNGKYKPFLMSGDITKSLASQFAETSNHTNVGEVETQSSTEYNNVNPFESFPGGGLRIKATVAPVGSANPINSGMLRYVDPQETAACWSVRKTWSPVLGSWDAFWLYINHYKLSDLPLSSDPAQYADNGEDDGGNEAGLYVQGPKYITHFGHSLTNYPSTKQVNLPGLSQYTFGTLPGQMYNNLDTPTLSASPTTGDGAYHTYTMCHTGGTAADRWITAIDYVIDRADPVPGDWTDGNGHMRQFDALLTYAWGDGSNDVGRADLTGLAVGAVIGEEDVDYFKVVKAHTPTATIPPGIPDALSQIPQATGIIETSFGGNNFLQFTAFYSTEPVADYATAWRLNDAALACPLYRPDHTLATGGPAPGALGTAQLPTFPAALAGWTVKLGIAPENTAGRAAWTEIDFTVPGTKGSLIALGTDQYCVQPPTYDVAGLTVASPASGGELDVAFGAPAVGQVPIPTPAKYDLVVWDPRLVNIYGHLTPTGPGTFKFAGLPGSTNFTVTVQPQYAAGVAALGNRALVANVTTMATATITSSVGSGTFTETWSFPAGIGAIDHYVADPQYSDGSPSNLAPVTLPSGTTTHLFSGAPKGYQYIPHVIAFNAAGQPLASATGALSAVAQ